MKQLLSSLFYYHQPLININSLMHKLCGPIRKSLIRTKDNVNVWYTSNSLDYISFFGQVFTDTFGNSDIGLTLQANSKTVVITIAKYNQFKRYTISCYILSI